MTTLYRMYLAADQIQKRVEACGGRVYMQSLFDAGWIYAVMSWRDGFWSLSDDEKAQHRDDFAGRFALAYPDAGLIRENGEIRFEWKTAAGVECRLTVGMGVCERVQVGTKVVTIPDPEYVASAPLVEVEEPVFEVRCPDPLVAL